MEAVGRCVYILFVQLCVFYITSTDLASPKNVADIRDFQAHIVANLDKCNLKIKITDPKYSSSLDEPLVISRSSDLESATTTPSHDSNESGKDTAKKQPVLNDKGEKGDPGEPGMLGPVGISGKDGKKGAKGEPGIKGEKGDFGEYGIPGIQGARGETGTSGEKGENGIKGDRGDKGDSGERGIQGTQGLKGETGTSGEKGENGIKGDKGDKGDPGERGIQGIQGPQGETGTSGEKGDNGLKGERGDKGDPGERGIQGEKGDIGPAGKDCTHDDLPKPEETRAKLGDVSRPAKSCADLKETGEFAVNPINSFIVYCNIEKSEMCLKLDPMYLLEDVEVEKESKVFDSKPFWINLDFPYTYNVVQSQMSYVLSQSTGVRQTIVYYCMNNEVIPKDNSKSLLLSLWSGQLVGPAPSRETPLSYIVQEDSCSESKNTWKSAIIKMETNFTNVLPILDIYIQDIRKEENQKYHIELKELCFSYDKPVKRKL